MPPRSRFLLLALPLALSGSFLAAAPLRARAAEEAPVVQGSVYGDYLAGIVAGSLGDAEAASSRLLGVLRSDPGDADLRNRAFIYSTLAGRPDAARLAPQVSGNPLAALVLGNAAARAGRWDAAQTSYTQVPASPLNDLLRPLLVAWSQQGAGHTDAALATLTPLAQASSGPGGSQMAGFYGLHAAMIADLAGRTQQAGRLYRQALTLYPGSDLVFVQSYASFLARGGRTDEARALVHGLGHALPLLAIAEPGLDASLSSAPVASPVQGLARVFLTMGSLLQQQGPRAREPETFMLRFALDLQPDLASARLLLADLQNGEDTPQAALSSLRLIPPGDPLAPVAALRIAVIEVANGKPAEGRSLLERLVRHFPNRPEPLQALGDLLQDQHDYAAAIDAYGRAIRLMSPLNGENWPILFSRATAYDRDAQWTDAQADLQHALRLAPNQPILLNYLGYSWVERKQDLEDARMMIERALDAKPDDGSIRDSLGWALLRQNDIGNAVRQLERAAEQMPEDPTVNYHLGVAYWAAGRHVEARDQWRWALLLHPDKQDEARIRAALHESTRPGADPLQAADALPLAHP